MGFRALIQEVSQVQSLEVSEQHANIPESSRCSLNHIRDPDSFQAIFLHSVVLGP